MANATHIHVDHVGSLLRPMALRKERERLLGVHDADRNLGAHTNAELTKIEDGYIRDVVKLQEDAGLPVVTDGEFRRRSWWTDFFLALTGTAISYNNTASSITMINAAGETRPMPTVNVTQKVTHPKSVVVEPFKFLKSVAKPTAKVSIPAPAMLHLMRNKDFVPSVYPDIEMFWEDLIKAYRQEIKLLADAGCKYVQLDECMFSYLCDPRHQAYLRSRGDDPEKLTQTYSRLIHEAIKDRPKDMTAAVHSCRGNMNSYWGASGGYEPVAQAMFNDIDADIYLLEYDTPRAGDFTPLRHVPKGKMVMLGLMSTKDKQLESADSLKRRIDEAAKELDIAQLGLCPQCGFSTNMFGSDFTEADEKRKLELLVQVGREVWGTV